MQAIVLSKPFDPTKLPTGLYVSRSDTDAYAVLAAMVAYKDAKLVGERYLDTGAKVITVRVGKATLQANAAGTISIGREFFVTALRDYRDWKRKWFRECIQNSVDAGAKHIDIRTKELDDGSWEVSCQDDGRGMDEDVLINKFLVLGGTTKMTGETAGGFGKAKELLVLPWLEWMVASRGMRVAGVGINYDIEPSSLVTQGTLIKVRMPTDNHTDEDAAINYIARCNLPGVEITVNGIKRDASARAGKAIRHLGDKAIIYHNKSLSLGGIHTRVKGLEMFETWMDYRVKGTVFVELQRSSVELLTANRDGYRDETLELAVSQFRDELSSDVQSALKDKSTLSRHIYRGAGNFDVEGNAAQMLLALPPLPELKKKPVELSKQAMQAIAEVAISQNLGVSSGLGAAVIRALMEAMLGGVQIKGQTHLEAVTKQLCWKPDFFNANEREGYRIEKRFQPDFMAPTAVKLMKVWTELCRFVLLQLGSSERYGVGFIFSDTAGAAWANDEGDNWLLINPYSTGPNNKPDFDHRRIVSPARKDDLSWLYAAAIHECTHMHDGFDKHNEDFTSAFTKNVALCAPGWRHVSKIVAAMRVSQKTVVTTEKREGLGAALNGVRMYATSVFTHHFKSTLDEAKRLADEGLFNLAMYLGLDDDESTRFSRSGDPSGTTIRFTFGDSDSKRFVYLYTDAYLSDLTLELALRSNDAMLVEEWNALCVAWVKPGDHHKDGWTTVQLLRADAEE